MNIQPVKNPALNDIFGVEAYDLYYTFARDHHYILTELDPINGRRRFQVRMRPQTTPSYRDMRRAAYPAITEQLDMIYWDGVNHTTVWADTIAAVKAKYPKPVATPDDSSSVQESL